LVEITDAMLEAGYSEQEIRMIMGESTLNFLAANLPLR
jgi:microsomal dipeptidase-like Zn-dependent dipeptidase